MDVHKLPFDCFDVACLSRLSTLSKTVHDLIQTSIRSRDIGKELLQYLLSHELSAQRVFNIVISKLTDHQVKSVALALSPRGAQGKRLYMIEPFDSNVVMNVTCVFETSESCTVELSSTQTAMVNLSNLLPTGDRVVNDVRQLTNITNSIDYAMMDFAFTLPHFHMDDINGRWSMHATTSLTRLWILDFTTWTVSQTMPLEIYQSDTLHWKSDSDHIPVKTFVLNAIMALRG